ncbi:MAG: DUF1015 family protein [Methanoregulaceae archaeon]|nr:DUF1015 family protein [Methanoregulaceae archaeon]
MVRIFRFAAVRPHRDAAPQVAAVPYDVVTADEAGAVIRNNPMSFLRISRPDAELPGIPQNDPRVYSHARDRFAALLSSGLFAPDPDPGMYVYRVITKACTFTGLCCCLHVDDYASGVIRRHEQTRYDKEEDRTRHIDTVNAHTGPVVLIYRDSADLSRLIASLASGIPDTEVRWQDESIHQIFRVSDTTTLSLLESEFSSVGRLYIADGHHRAKSAVNVAKQRMAAGKEPGEADRFMGVLFADSGVRIHGYSRLVRDLGGRTAGDFMQEISRSCLVHPYGTVNQGAYQIPPRTNLPHIFHMYLDRAWYECALPGSPSSDLIGSLDVSLLQHRVLEGILGISDPRGDARLQYLGGARPVADLEAMVDRGDYAVAFSMQPVRVETVLSIADADMIMPPKSTWFEPKLLSGLLVHSLS